MRNCSVVLLLFGFLTAAPAAQGPLPTLSASDFAALQQQVPRKPLPATEWVMMLPATARRGAVAALPPAAQRPLNFPVARERDPQLMADRLVIVAVDATGAPLDWRIVPDPRVVRSETPDAAGLLSGTVLTHPEAELRVAIAAGAAAHAVRIYKPRWAGDVWALDPIAASTAR